MEMSVSTWWPIVESKETSEIARSNPREILRGGNDGEERRLDTGEESFKSTKTDDSSLLESNKSWKMQGFGDNAFLRRLCLEKEDTESEGLIGRIFLSDAIRCIAGSSSRLWDDEFLGKFSGASSVFILGRDWSFALWEVVESLATTGGSLVTGYELDWDNCVFFGEELFMFGARNGYVNVKSKANGEDQ